MSKKRKIAISVTTVVAALAVFFGGYEYGQYRCKPCPKPVVQKEKKKDVVKKPAKSVKVAKTTMLPATAWVAPTPTPALPMVMATVVAPTLARLYTIRLNIVEGDEIFIDAPFSRDIGPIIRKRMAEGKVTWPSAPINFKVEWRQGGSRLAGKIININNEAKTLPVDFTDRWMVDVTAQNGQATISVDPAMIGPETELYVWSNSQFATPPDRLPLVTSPGELYNQIKQGIQETYLHFILLPSPPTH